METVLAEEMQVTLRCPLCDGEHRYPVEVRRSVTFAMVSQWDAREWTRRIRRWFVCPVENRRFTGTLTFMESDSSRVEEVHVGSASEAA